MTTNRTVIIGAGRGGVQTALSLRDAGYSGEVVLLDQEGVMPYERPPLSKGFLAGETTPNDLLILQPDRYQDLGITVRLGQPARAIDLRAGEVELDGQRLRYDHVVLATGASARSLPIPGADDPRVMGLRSLADATHLRYLLTSARRLVVVGAGFLGLEVAASARARGLDVTVIEAMPHILARTTLPELADVVLRNHRAAGIRIETGTSVQGIRAATDGLVVDTGAETHPADVVLASIGAVPRTDLARDAGLVLSDGIVVDENLSAAPGVWAIGDCARFPSPRARSSIRLESIQNATDQARHVAEQIVTGELSEYSAVPWFWSDQGQLSLQSAGLITGYDRTVTVGRPESDRLTVLAFEGSRLLGGDSLGDGGGHLAVRRMLRTGVNPSPEECERPDFELKSQSRRASVTDHQSLV